MYHEPVYIILPLTLGGNLGFEGLNWLGGLNGVKSSLSGVWVEPQPQTELCEFYRHFQAFCSSVIGQFVIHKLAIYLLAI